jgi:hypothetical protein
MQAVSVCDAIRCFLVALDCFARARNDAESLFGEALELVIAKAPAEFIPLQIPITKAFGWASEDPGGLGFDFFPDQRVQSVPGGQIDFNAHPLLQQPLRGHQVEGVELA